VGDPLDRGQPGVLDQNAAGTDHHEGTERGIPTDARGQFGARRGGLAHHDPQSQAADPADVGLVRDARLVGFEHDRIADLAGGRQGSFPQCLPARRVDHVGLPQARHRLGDGQAADGPCP
jgi:hypothetical protein